MRQVPHAVPVHAHGVPSRSTPAAQRARHVVHAAHVRSVDAVGTAASYVPEEHAVTSEQRRSVVFVGFADSYWTPTTLHVASVPQRRLDVAVPATVWYSVAVQTVCSMHLLWPARSW